MSSKTKIIGTVDRYKRPVLMTKVEGRGKMIKTILTNIEKVARALQVPPSYPTKYFSLKIGCQCNVDPSKGAYSIAGAATAADLEEILEEFIAKCVLCPQCNLPETVMKVKKKVINRNCRACPYYGELSVDRKMDAFIVRNPPPKAKEFGGAAAAAGAAADDGSDDDENLGMQGPSDLLEGPPPEIDINDEDIEWGDDATEEAAAARRQAEIGASAVLNNLLEHDENWTLEDSARQFEEWYNENNPDKEITPDIVAKTMERGELIGRSHDHTPGEVLGLICHVILNAEFLTKIAALIPIFKEYVTDAKTQRVVLGNIERVTEMDETLLKSTTNLLTALYNADILEEEVIVKWHGKSSKYVGPEHAAKVREAAQPFIDWVNEASSSYSYSESEDEEDGDDDESPDDTRGTGKAADDGDDDDDGEGSESDSFDIDDV